MKTDCKSLQYFRRDYKSRQPAQNFAYLLGISDGKSKCIWLNVNTMSVYQILLLQCFQNTIRLINTKLSGLAKI